MATVTAEPPRRTRRRNRVERIPLWRRARRTILVACLFCLAISAASWIPAVTRQRNIPITIASVEWLRSHGGNAIVTQIENWYYTLNEPEKGGPTLTSLPQVGVGAAAGGGSAAGRRSQSRVSPFR